MPHLPTIIQGGMGVGVSNWRLAQAVSKTGQLGVVSGTALDQVLVRRLSDGDPGGHMRRALGAFPFPAIASRIVQEYFIPGGKTAGKPYPTLTMHHHRQPRKLMELCMAANFAEVFLARQGHGNAVGINYLEKVQLPHLASIYGAMLAGVSYVLMGAGIPLQVPGVLDAYTAHLPAEYKLTVTGPGVDRIDSTMIRFDPAEYAEGPLPRLLRPRFLAIVSSHTLAATLLRRANGIVNGFVIEGYTAGGHNAPPRGKLQLTETGEPQYGIRDKVDLAEVRALGADFWLAGGYGSSVKLAEARSEGATGVQVGTAFAFSEESGLREDLKRELILQSAAGLGRAFTDPLASPTGFPFKVALLQKSVSDALVYTQRTRVCDVGLLREPFACPDGSIVYRCSAEPVACYVQKGGTEDATSGRKCLCNALLANIGYAQVRAPGVVEPPLVTLGDDLSAIVRFLAPGQTSYHASDVIAAILGTLASAEEPALQ